MSRWTRKALSQLSESVIQDGVYVFVHLVSAQIIN